MAAVTLATIATVAAVVAKVSFYVGMVGLALKVVGAVTKNKTLSKIGTYMGYAGLAGGIVGGGVSLGFSELSQGIFESNVASTNALGQLSQEQVGQHVASLGATPFDQAASPFAGMSAPADFGGPIMMNNEPVLRASVEGQLHTLGDSVLAPVQDTGTVPPPVGRGLTHELPPNTEAQPETPSAPKENVTKIPGPPQLTTHGGDPRFQEKDFGEWLKGVDPSVKAMGGLAIGQTAAGAAQGWFAGQSAEEKLAFDKQVNAQRQTELERRIFNASNTPFVYRNRNGMLQQGGA